MMSRHSDEELCSFKESDLLYDIINHTKCESGEASDIIRRMNQLGLERSIGDTALLKEQNWNLLKFASMRDYVAEKK